jgi:hypothetical protein
VTVINGKSVREWPASDMANLAFAGARTTVTFTLTGGGIRRVRESDYF